MNGAPQSGIDAERLPAIIAESIPSMPTKDNNQMIHRLRHQGREFVLVGTAHVSRESVELVREIVEQEQPDTVCVELCESRFQSLRQNARWKDMDIVKVIREKKSFLLLSNLLLASFQKRIAEKLDIQPGQEMIQAVESAEAIGAAVELADRDIRITLSRTWRHMGFWAKIKLGFQLLMSMGEAEEIDEETVERLKNQDVLESVLAEVGQSMPVVRRILIDERDRYLSQKIRNAPGDKVVAVVGAGHLGGILRCWEESVHLQDLETLPEPSVWTRHLKWILPGMILALLVGGFFYGGARTGSHMIAWWVLANGVLAGVGAIAALAHPFTVVSSVIAAPLTSLNPMIAAGWVSGLVEAFTRKPKVIDFENLPVDITTFKGFWRNKITRILLVVVFTNLGSAAGTFIAIPLMIRVL